MGFSLHPSPFYTKLKVNTEGIECRVKDFTKVFIKNRWLIDLQNCYGK